MNDEMRLLPPPRKLWVRLPGKLANWGQTPVKYFQAQLIELASQRLGL